VKSEIEAIETKSTILIEYEITFDCNSRSTKNKGGNKRKPRLFIYNFRSGINIVAISSIAITPALNKSKTNIPKLVTPFKKKNIATRSENIKKSRT
jgi:hypothetical protein